MTDRRTLLLDAALELVGTQGMRGLTHRAVDAAAGLPPGSTSSRGPVAISRSRTTNRSTMPKISASRVRK